MQQHIHAVTFLSCNIRTSFLKVCIEKQKGRRLPEERLFCSLVIFIVKEIKIKEGVPRSVSFLWRGGCPTRTWVLSLIFFNNKTFKTTERNVFEAVFDTFFLVIKYRNWNVFFLSKSPLKMCFNFVKSIIFLCFWLLWMLSSTNISLIWRSAFEHRQAVGRWLGRLLVGINPEGWWRVIYTVKFIWGGLFLHEQSNFRRPTCGSGLLLPLYFVTANHLTLGMALWRLPQAFLVFEDPKSIADICLALEEDIHSYVLDAKTIRGWSRKKSRKIQILNKFKQKRFRTQEIF